MEQELADRLRERFARAPTVGRVEEAIARGDNNLVITNAAGGSPALLAAHLAARAERPLLILTGTLEAAEALADGMSFFGVEPLLFPPLETLPFETAEPALHVAAARAAVLTRLVAAADPEASPPTIVAPIDALLVRIPPATVWRELALDLRWGETVDLDALAARLTRMGYARQALVESPGEFAIRGTILDLFPPEADLPCRLDLFGEEIESIRRFDPRTQRSLPAEGEIERLKALPRALLEPARDVLAAGGRLTTFLDLLPPETLLILAGPTRLEQRLEHFEQVAERHWAETLKPADGEPPNFFHQRGLRPEHWILPPAEARAALARFPAVAWADLETEAGHPDGPRTRIAVGAQGLQTVPSDFATYAELIREKQLEGYRIAIACDNFGQVQRLEELLWEAGVPAMAVGAPPRGAADGRQPRAPLPLGAHDVALVVGELHEGFLFPAARLLLITDREIFGRYRRRRIYRKAFRGKIVSAPSEIERGDFVVHRDHGIGRFEGIRRQQVDGRLGEFLEIGYQDGDKLLLPIDRLHLVQKYASVDGREPALDRLGGRLWSRRRRRTEETVRRLAGELLELHARRRTAEKIPCGPDSVWQQEFEASFIYQETPDQLRAIGEIKTDLMSPRPADRLLCGDVGFGKTEVAIRAAFKVLQEGRQVAVLVPTTILAQQHHRTFSERLAGYPFVVEMLSRFRSPAEQKAVVAGLAAGRVDLVIGTHRLLSRDVRFADLGLLVIDEEQRFGVAQKERIKSLRASVDVLSMTATPIPRTLHMALSKLRDLSIIETPPADRLPIKTRTIYFERDPIEEALLRELNRGGQVYFVHNRIESIHEVAETLRQIVPRARIAVAHGRTDEAELERLMLDFIAGNYDILLSTTIIENGIDIPNVNTIIVNRADAMGLAQLYQLRGRVGRDVRQAYAYLVLPRGRPITDTALKRLQALEEFSELGMGFAIAMRDMEIRGAGNLLGREQSGAIAEIGFDLYCQLLEEAVMELKGEGPAEPLWPTEIKWPAEQWLPEPYVPVEAQRIHVYRALASARGLEDLDAISEELRDRYGPLPAEAVNLLNAFQVRLALAPWRVDVVRGESTGQIRLVGRNVAAGLLAALESRRADAPGLERLARRGEDQLILSIAPERWHPERALAELAAWLRELPPPEPQAGGPKAEAIRAGRRQGNSQARP